MARTISLGLSEGRRSTGTALSVCVCVHEDRSLTVPHAQLGIVGILYAVGGEDQLLTCFQGFQSADNLGRMPLESVAQHGVIGILHCSWGRELIISPLSGQRTSIPSNLDAIHGCLPVESVAQHDIIGNLHAVGSATFRSAYISMDPYPSRSTQVPRSLHSCTQPTIHRPSFSPLHAIPRISFYRGFCTFGCCHSNKSTHRFSSIFILFRQVK